MNIVVPLSTADEERIEYWLQCIRRFGGLEAHSVTFLPRHQVEGKAYEAMGRISDICKDVKVHVMRDGKGQPEDCGDVKWPKAPNWHWFQATKVTDNSPVPWFWMELDCLPVRAGWADTLAGAYTSGGNPLMGSIVKVPFREGEFLPPNLASPIPFDKQEKVRNPNAGKIVTSPEGESDTMMCGCGIYPGQLPTKLRRMGQDGMLNSFMQGESSVEEPWDVFMRFAFRRMGMANTESIQDMWNTCNYRIEGDKLICDAYTEGEHAKFVGRARSGQVNPNAAVIHGCKDATLATLVINGLDTRSLAPLPLPAFKVKEVVESPEIAAVKGEVSDLKKMMGVLMEQNAQLLRERQQPVTPVPHNIEPVSQTSEEIEEDEPKERPKKIIKKKTADADDIAEQVLTLINKSKKSLRAPDAAKQLKVPEAKIRQLAEDPSSGFIMSGPARWLKAS